MGDWVPQSHTGSSEKVERQAMFSPSNLKFHVVHRVQTIVSSLSRVFCENSFLSVAASDRYFSSCLFSSYCWREFDRVNKHRLVSVESIDDHRTGGKENVDFLCILEFLVSSCVTVYVSHWIPAGWILGMNSKHRREWIWNSSNRSWWNSSIVKNFTRVCTRSFPFVCRSLFSSFISFIASLFWHVCLSSFYSFSLTLSSSNDSLSNKSSFELMSWPFF